jgi:oligopeptide/dipeptide ABC transporter ATP-binding protein
MTPLLETRDLRRHYTVRTGIGGRRATVRAVDGVWLTVTGGQTLGLVGESGCGKSTLARTLVLLEPPDHGEIRFEGRPVRPGDVTRLRRRIQLVFQDPYTSLPPRMRVGTIVAEPLRIHRLASGRELSQRVTEMLAEVGLPADLAGARPGELSGGQRQRVGIARALALGPSLLVADEPVSALDVSVQAQILNLLRDLQRRHGLTMLFVSHDISVVTYLSHQIAVMYLGEIVETGPAEQVSRQPLHPYTRALMSAIPSLERRDRPRLVVRGDPPDPKEPPPGCRFHPRCPLAQQICRTEPPPLLTWLPGRRAACHFALEGIETTPGEGIRT